MDSFQDVEEFWPPWNSFNKLEPPMFIWPQECHLVKIQNSKKQSMSTSKLSE
jgi:hypothetical protein